MTAYQDGYKKGRTSYINCSMTFAFEGSKKYNTGQERIDYMNGYMDGWNFEKEHDITVQL